MNEADCTPGTATVFISCVCVCVCGPWLVPWIPNNNALRERSTVYVGVFLRWWWWCFPQMSLSYEYNQDKNFERSLLACFTLLQQSLPSYLFLSSRLNSSLWRRSPWWSTRLGWGNRPVTTTPSRMTSWWSSQSWTATRRSGRVELAAWVNAAGGTSVLSAFGLKRTCSSSGTTWDVLEVIHVWLHIYTSDRQAA